jgi:hypothetical protein
MEACERRGVNRDLPAIEVLHVPECVNLGPMLERLREATALPVTTREVRTEAEAAAWGMAGSPTLLVDGLDPFAQAQRCECRVSCRLYRDENGQITPAPSVGQIRDALARAETTHPPATSCPGELLSTWRTRAFHLDAVETAVHQEILRTYARTGAPPDPRALEAVTAGSDRSADAALVALHELDALRLTTDGQIALAYPFSTQPTRHRVTIGHQVKAYAMCAIDALGMSAMLGQDVTIESHDVTTGQPVTVTVRAGQSPGQALWNPPEAVVFVGADAGGGPSADCCCDHLNFFADTTSSATWIQAHPHVPGQVVTQIEAEELGVRLFAPMLEPR